MVTHPLSGTASLKSPPAASFLQTVDILLLTPRLIRPPMALLSGLRNRHASFRLTSSTADVLCSAIRRHCRAVVIHEPGRFPQAAELRQGLSLYASTLECWQSSISGGKLQLEKFPVPEGVEELIESRSVHQWNQQAADAREKPSLEPDYQPGDIEGVFLKPTVTEEELDMLLGPIPERKEFDPRKIEED